MYAYSLRPADTKIQLNWFPSAASSSSSAVILMKDSISKSFFKLTFKLKNVENYLELKIDDINLFIQPIKSFFSNQKMCYLNKYYGIF